MKVLFLDIDGVCNNHKTEQRFMGYLGINPKLAARIKTIIRETECKVVLSSTWRLDAEFREEVERVVCRFIDVTPNHVPLRFRGNEIQSWLDEHPQVTKYAIVDDNSDFNPGQPLFQTSNVTGITDVIMKKIINYLNEVEE